MHIIYLLHMHRQAYLYICRKYSEFPYFEFSVFKHVINKASLTVQTCVIGEARFYTLKSMNDVIFHDLYYFDPLTMLYMNRFQCACTF